MLYLVHMVVTPPSPNDTAFAELIVAEKEYALELQRTGIWRHLWRVVGQYENYSVFDVAGNDELHEVLSNLPLSPYLRHTVTALATHPSALQP